MRDFGRVTKSQSHHLDAGLLEWLPSTLGIPDGNGSPSAQTAPSSKYSFFQIGTVFLKVSIIQRQASNATPRWAEATAISTLVSPISNRPSRWTIDTARTPKRVRDSVAKDFIC